jgi:3-oxo-5-alpha-steroid 4-dehydrogenase 3
MYLIVFICACLVILTILSVCAQQIHELRASVLSYGKLNLHSDKKPTTTWASQLAKLTVPKHYFSHFYVIGLITACMSIIELTIWSWYKRPLLLVYLLQKYDAEQGSDHANWYQSVIGLALMTCHLARRVYESFWIERPSKTATMHVSHYLVGVGFYGAMVLGTWLEGASNFDIWPKHSNGTLHPWTISTTVISILLFIYASYHQYNCHVILASLRKERHGYMIPRGDWFEMLVTPHYFADILIYLSLNILFCFHNYVLICGLVWTIANLSIVSNETQAWYYKHFTTEKYYEAFPHGRYRIIPYCY